MALVSTGIRLVSKKNPNLTMATARNKLRKGDAGRDAGGFVGLPWAVLELPSLRPAIYACPRSATRGGAALQAG